MDYDGIFSFKCVEQPPGRLQCSKHNHKAPRSDRRPDERTDECTEGGQAYKLICKVDLNTQGTGNEWGGTLASKNAQDRRDASL